MEATIVLVLFLAFLVGGMLLALVMGYRSIEEEREQTTARVVRHPRLQPGAAVPGFFASAAARPVGGAALSPEDEALVARLEQHVLAEHATVAQFVHYPSLDSLYRHSGSTLHVH